MTTTKRLKMAPHVKGDDWYVYIHESHYDYPEGASWRERMEQTRHYEGRPLFTGTADACTKWINENRSEIECYETI